jgi:ABC-type uncharacterized transport system permease subunit
MNQLLWASFLLSAASYLAACGFFLAQVRRRHAVRLAPTVPLRLLEIGAVLHLVYMIVFSVMDRRCPVYSMHSALGIISLVGVVTYAVVGRGRRLEALGSFVSASAALFLIAAHAIAANPSAVSHRWTMAIHITANFLGGGILLVAGCASAFYLWSERRLRRHRSLGQGPRLPPLESLDAVVHRLLWIGLPLLTVGILTARLVMKTVETVNTADRIRAVLAVASWLLLLVVLLLRQWKNWRGRRAAYAALAGTAGILLVILLYISRAIFGVG